ncbi:MAG TPA: zf-HC2 domain-containing protein [Thiobacillus sp.]
MLTCQASSHLISESQDRPLGWFEALGLRMHLLMCNSCRRVESQIALMRRVLRQSGLASEDSAPLSAEAHERISQRLASQAQ